MIVNIYSVTLVIYYVYWSWSDFLSALIMALLSGVQRVSSLGISIVSLQNEGFLTVCLCLTTDLMLQRKATQITEFGRQTVVHESLLGQC